MSAKIVFDDSQIIANGGDIINELPTDETFPSKDELKILNTLFKNQGTVQKIFDKTKDVLLVGFLFIILAIPQVDDLVYKIAPSTASSPYILIFVKALIFMFLFFVVQNMYLVRS